ncbi:hypothetical protein D3C73_1294460 [compost metagenome]
MPVQHLIQCLVQSLRLQRAADANHPGQVVSSAVRGHLLQEPQALLGEGHGRRGPVEAGGDALWLFTGVGQQQRQYIVIDQVVHHALVATDCCCATTRPPSMRTS